MKPNFSEILKEHNQHNTLLDSKGVLKAMNVCYELGKNDGVNEVISLISNMEHLSDNIQYIKEEWKNQKQ